MIALALRSVLLVALANAPFQCASDPDPERRLEDTPSEALWMLAERFGEEGDPAARRTTLEQLVERYPSSREAERARLELEGRGQPSGTSGDAVDPESGEAADDPGDD